MHLKIFPPVKLGVVFLSNAVVPEASGLRDFLQLRRCRSVFFCKNIGNPSCPKTGRTGLFHQQVLALLRSLDCADSLGQHGNDLEQVAADAIVGDLKDGSSLVLVDSDDALGVLHTSLCWMAPEMPSATYTLG